MRRTENAKNNVNSGVSCCNSSGNHRAGLAVTDGKFLVFRSHLKNRDGFIALHLLGIFLVAVIIFFAVMMGTAFGARKMAVMTYHWFGEAMNYASSAAAMQGLGTGSPINEQVAERVFTTGFAQMTDTLYANGKFTPNSNSPYPGPIVLDRFDAVSGHGSTEPGYIAEITVPVLGADLPFLGHQYMTVPMRYFAVGKNTDLP